MEFTTLKVSRAFKKNIFSPLKRKLSFEKNRNFTDEQIIFELIKNYQTETKNKPTLGFQGFLAICLLRKLTKDNKNTLEELKKGWNFVEKEISVSPLLQIIEFLKKRGDISESNGKLHLSEKYM